MADVEKISIITPVGPAHARFLDDAWQGILRQEGARGPRLEWVLVANGGVDLAAWASKPLVRIVEYDGPTEGGRASIGALKRQGFSAARGDVLVELDADDILTPEALGAIVRAFTDPSVQFVYSNSAQFDDGTWRPGGYSERYGWRSRPYRDEDGHELIEMVAFPPTPHALRLIYWAPNHVRAWRKPAYDALDGGHDPDLWVGDDHDLVCRTYIKYGSRGLRHIDQCLYLYRTHAENSCQVWNADVQRVTQQNYRRHIAAMAERWATETGLRMIDLGGRFQQAQGYEAWDLHGSPPVDLEGDWPATAGEIGVLRAVDIVEHLASPIHTMNEAWRVLAPGGWLFIEAPSTEGAGAWQDPLHKSYWNANSIYYYTHEEMRAYIRPEFQGQFQLAWLETFIRDTFVGQVPYIRAHLIAIKPGMGRVPGEIR